MSRTAAAEIEADGIARAFLDARRSGGVVARYPGTMPTELDAAYRVQDRAIALVGAKVGGWKVGKINPPANGIDRLVGPIFAEAVIEAVGKPIKAKVFEDGFAAAEAEFLLRLGRAPDPAKTSYTVAEAADLIDAVHVGIEIASSPFPGINDNGSAVTISDFGNNNGLVIGPEVKSWRDAAFQSWPVTLEINGHQIGAATADKMLDGPFGAARFLFENLSRRGFAIAPGAWISTGAVTGVHCVSIGDEVVARFGDALSVACSIAAYRPNLLDPTG